jgi:hypothetical protein
MSGAHYYVSMKQVIDSDRKIRALSLIKYNDFCLTDIGTSDESSTVSLKPSEHGHIADAIAEALQLTEQPSANDATQL